MFFDYQMNLISQDMQDQQQYVQENSGYFTHECPETGEELQYYLPLELCQ